MHRSRSLAPAALATLALTLLCLPSPADAAEALLSERNQSQVHAWDSADPGNTTLFHATQCNDADLNIPEGSAHGWVPEHFSDYFGRFVIGGNGLDAQHNLGQNGLTHYHYPKHIMVYNDEIVVMSRNDATIWRYSTDGAQIGSLATGNGTGQGLATDGVDFYASFWNGSSYFVRYDSNFTPQQTIQNPSGMNGLNNLFDLIYDPETGHFFGLATTGEGGTGTQSNTVLEFEMGGAVINTYQLPFMADGIGRNSATLCGDGVVEGDEVCDDGNDVDTDMCTNACEEAACGDGLVYEGVEACDDGNDIDTFIAPLKFALAA